MLEGVVIRNNSETESYKSRSSFTKMYYFTSKTGMYRNKIKLTMMYSMTDKNYNTSLEALIDCIVYKAVFSSSGRRPASLCHGLLSVVRPSVR